MRATGVDAVLCFVALCLFMSFPVLVRGVNCWSHADTPHQVCSELSGCEQLKIAGGFGKDRIKKKK